MSTEKKLSNKPSLRKLTKQADIEESSPYLFQLEVQKTSDASFE